MSDKTLIMNGVQLLFIFCTVVEISAYRILKTNEVNKLFVKHGESVKIVCEDDVPLARCGFTHPNETRVLFLDLSPGTPECKLSVVVSEHDVGLWTCHIWPQFAPQLEIKKNIEVRITKKFAAINTEIVAQEGDQVTLSCTTTETMVPLNHCYFITPAGKRLNMMDGITSENALMDRYYFPVNKSIHRGDCGVTIKAVTREDKGTWYCNGWLEDDEVEYGDLMSLVMRDVFEIDSGDRIFISNMATENGYYTTTAMAIYISVPLLLSVSAAFVVWKLWRRVCPIIYLYKNTDCGSVNSDVQLF